MNGFLPMSNYFRIPGGLRISALSSGPVMPAVLSRHRDVFLWSEVSVGSKTCF
jgi:hypothetical protein